MSMRNLSKESGLSMIALYAYFPSKEELLELLQNQHGNMVKRVFQDRLKENMGPLKMLETAIRIHLYLSEAMQPWFYFAYMEVKNMHRIKQEKAKAGELSSEKIFSDILFEGLDKNVFREHNCELVAGIIILFSDLRGFTVISENYSPSSVIEMLNRYFSEMSEIIVPDHSGIIDKFMGDSIMALFSGGRKSAGGPCKSAFRN